MYGWLVTPSGCRLHVRRAFAAHAILPSPAAAAAISHEARPLVINPVTLIPAIQMAYPGPQDTRCPSTSDEGRAGKCIPAGSMITTSHTYTMYDRFNKLMCFCMVQGNIRCRLAPSHTRECMCLRQVACVQVLPWRPVLQHAPPHSFSQTALLALHWTLDIALTHLGTTTDLLTGPLAVRPALSTTLITAAGSTDYSQRSIIQEGGSALALACPLCLLGCSSARLSLSLPFILCARNALAECLLCCYLCWCGLHHAVIIQRIIVAAGIIPCRHMHEWQAMCVLISRAAAMWSRTAAHGVCD